MGHLGATPGEIILEKLMHTTSRSVWFALVFVITTASLISVAQVATATLPTAILPVAAATNPVTNTIYVANNCGTDPSCGGGNGTVTVIDGSTLVLQSVTVGSYPSNIAINTTTNKIYVATCGTDPTCSGPGTVTVIDGVTLNTTNVTVGTNPDWVGVNPVTNKIYAVNLSCNSIPCNVQGTVTVIDGVTLATQTVNVGYTPYSLAVDSVHNKIYVANVCGDTGNCGQYGTVTVIDGATLNTQSVTAQELPYRVAVNTTTNMAYAVNNCGSDTTCQSAGSVTAINGSTLGTQSVAIGWYPLPIAVNETTNTIYVGNQCSALLPTCYATLPSVVAINGSTLATTTTPICSIDTYPSDVEVNSVTNQVYMPCSGRNNGGGTTGLSVAALNAATNTVTQIAVGDYPYAAGINSTTNTIYVPNAGDDTVSVIGGSTKLQLVNVAPCRLVDTRPGNGGGGPIPGGTFQTFNLPQAAQAKGCADLSSAASYSLNVTVVPQGALGYLTIWPAAQIQPVVSTMNSLDGRIKADAVTIQAGVSGAVDVFVTNTANVVLDIDGYYTPSSSSTLEFYPLTPCRVLDTRNTNGDLGGPYLQSGQERQFPVLSSNCQIPSNAQAYSMNFTVVPYQGQALGYLTVWPTGNQQPVVSTLNNLTATIVANAAIVPAGTDGKISVYPSGNTQLVGDINGYFAAPGSGGQSLYPTAPCRVLDTRNGNGAFSGQLAVNVAGSACTPPATAQAYVFNATVVPVTTLGYLTLWPDGENRPVVSTLNAVDGAITSNMAIVPNVDGTIDAYADQMTQLILDISSYFAP